MLISYINLEYYPLLSALPSHYFPSVSDRWFGGVGATFSYLHSPPFGGVGGGFLPPLSGRVGVGLLFIQI